MKRVLTSIVCGLVLNVIAVINASGAQWLTTEQYGNGSNGAYAPSTGTDAPINFAMTGTAGNAYWTTCGGTTGMVAGQLVLIHQTQGTGAGNWELNKLLNPAVGSLVYTLINSYGTGAQILVMPQYSSGNIAGGVTLTAKAWNGTVGGIVGWFCNGTTTVTGSIVNSARGYRGGAGISSGNTSGRRGEGTTGNDQAATAAAQGNGAGAAGVPKSNGYSSGGSSGGHAAAGAQGAGDDPKGAAGGAGGAVALTTAIFGGGGSSGSSNNGADAGGTGGAGGGGVFIFSKTITITGSIANNGATGGNSAASTGGAGGGAGGFVLLKCQTATLGTGLITATGGAGGTAVANAYDYRRGGAGSVGRIHADYGTSCTVTTSPTLDKTQNSIYIPNAPPTDPSSPTPSNGAYTQNNAPLCSWSASTDADSDPITYYYALSSNPNLSDPIVNDISTWSSTQYQNSALSDRTYYWRVRAYDGKDYNQNSATWSFTVDTQAPSVPVITRITSDPQTGKIVEFKGTG